MKGLKKSIHLHVYCFLKSHVFIFFACQVQRIYTILTFHLSFSKYTLAFHIYWYIAKHRIVYSLKIKKITLEISILYFKH